MMCPRCQYNNAPTMKFCGECGTPRTADKPIGPPAPSYAEITTALTGAQAQVRELLEQQTATSEILRVIASSPTDVQPVFDTIIKNAVRLCDVQEGSVFRFDGQLIHLVASETSDTEFLDTLHRVFPRPPGRDSPTARAVLTRAVTHVTDILALRVTEARDQHGESWEHVDTIGRGDDLGLDPRRGEEQVDAASRGVVPGRQCHGRQAPGGVLLD